MERVSMNDDKYCDIETGICGPTDEDAPISGFIDLSAPKNEGQLEDNKTEPVKE